MEKFIQQYQGIILFLMAQGIAVAMALVNMNKRLSLMEDRMTEARKDIDECQKALTAFRDNIQSIQIEARLTEERLKNISEMAKEALRDMQKAMELRQRQ